MGRTETGPAPPDDLQDQDLLDYLVRTFPQFEDGSPVNRRDLGVNRQPFFAHLVGGKPGPDDVTVVRCDASFKEHVRHGKVGAIAWQMKTPRRAYVAKAKAMQRFPGKSAMAEVFAAIHGMRQALDVGVRHVLIMTDNQNVVHYLARTWHTDEDSYTRQPRNELEALADQFDSVQVQWVRTRPTLNDVDSLAKRTMKAEFERLAQGWDGYVDRIAAVMQKEVHRVQVSGAMLYDGRFAATADPPYCPCYYFEHNTLPALTRNPRNRLKTVCKHLAAAFVDAGCGAEDMAVFMRDHFVARKRGQERPVLRVPELSNPAPRMPAAEAPSPRTPSTPSSNR